MSLARVVGVLVCAACCFVRSVGSAGFRRPGCGRSLLSCLGLRAIFLLPSGLLASAVGIPWF